MKKYNNRIKNKISVYGISLITIVVLISLSILLVYMVEERLRSNQEYEVRIAYYNLIDEIDEIVNENVSLQEGFSAYINTIDTYEDDSIYRYLDFLLKDKLKSIRNVSVFQDTTIKWVYPLEGNEDAIGVDLSKVPEQADAINKVKKERVKLFVGPVDLVQGGTGFIVRLPLIKKNEFWGMVSIVLRSEITFDFVREYSEKHQMEYLITHSGEPNNNIFGNPEILDMNPLKYNTDESLGGWDIYTVPMNGWNDYSFWKSIAYLFGGMISLLGGFYMFRWLSDYNSAIEGKNDLEQKYIRDRFTGIYTREYFNARANEEFSHALRNNYPVSMVYFDLDHFKEANDEHGHLVGDKVLLEIVELVNAIIRKEDVFARWGGDEFIILMPETDLSEVKLISERIRRKVENIEICKSLNVTVSVGCSQWVENEYLESWFLRTDKALYESKNSGKNKVSFSDPKEESNILSKIDWVKKWDSGNIVIDEEHKVLLDRCNIIIESSLSRSATDDIIINIDSFFDELRNHFAHEIEILESINYPEIEYHKKKHNEILSEGNHIYENTINNKISLMELFSFLINTVIKDHLIKEDHNYFKYLK